MTSCKYSFLPMAPRGQAFKWDIQGVKVVLSNTLHLIFKCACRCTIHVKNGLLLVSRSFILLLNWRARWFVTQNHLWSRPWKLFGKGRHFQKNTRQVIGWTICHRLSLVKFNQSHQWTKWRSRKAKDIWHPEKPSVMFFALKSVKKCSSDIAIAKINRV